MSKNAGLFPGVDPSKLAGNAYGAFDGLQVTSTAPAAGAPASSSIYYAGSPTKTHYRGGLVIGVAMPVNIYKLLSGKN